MELVLKPELIDFLIDTVGKDQVTTELIDLISHSTDASMFKHRPEVVVYATTTEQVSAILKMVHEERIPITPLGGGTNLSGETVPVKGGIVLDLSRMDQILEINLEDRVAVVQPGVIYAGLNKRLTRQGFMFPPDPSSGPVATIGGNVSTNAGGVRAGKYGVTKDYVRGLEVVLPGGRVMRTGTRAVKSSSGYNLSQIFVGSEGTLGVITEITLKVAPKPTETYVTLATFQTLVDAGRAVSQIMRSGAVPSVLEIVEKNCIKAINQNTDLDLPEVEAILLTETDGFVKEDAMFQMNKIVDIFKENGVLEIKWAQTTEEAEAIWNARKSAYAVISRLNNAIIAEDVTVPLSKVPDMLNAIEELGAKHGLILPTVGHLSDGNIHPHFSFDRTKPDEVARVKKAEEELCQKTIELGGTLSGEHGIGLAKARFMSMEHDPVAMDTMRSLKKMFDPHNILNPGKMNLESRDD
jgi:glycolate dehydrogenase FAD-linked subunit